MKINKEYKYLFIYKTTNLINGKFYVGHDSKNDPEYLGSGLYLERAIKKYGKENFKKEILEFCKTFDELVQREEFWIEQLKATDNNIAYNLSKKGNGGDTLTYHPNRKEIGTKISKSLKAKNIKMSDEQKELRRNYKHTDEAKNQMSQKRKGLAKTDPEYIEKLRQSNIEAYKNLDIRKKISNKLKGQKRTDEQKAKMKNNGLNAIRTKYIIQTPEGNILEILSANEVKRITNCKSRQLFIKGKCKGYILLNKINIKQ